MEVSVCPTSNSLQEHLILVCFADLLDSPGLACSYQRWSDDGSLPSSLFSPTPANNGSLQPMPAGNRNNAYGDLLLQSLPFGRTGSTDMESIMTERYACKSQRTHGFCMEKHAVTGMFVACSAVARQCHCCVLAPPCLRSLRL